MWWPFSRSEHHASPDAQDAAIQAVRALTDARNLDGRAERVAESLAEIRRTNHIAAAVTKSIRGA